MDKYTDNLFDKIESTIGSEKLAQEMYQAMATKQARDILEYIARNYDIE